MVSGASHSANMSLAGWDKLVAPRSDAAGWMVRDSLSRRILGGCRLGCADSATAAGPPAACDSGFWLYANPMRVIQSVLIVCGRCHLDRDHRPVARPAMRRRKT